MLKPIVLFYIAVVVLLYVFIRSSAFIWFQTGMQLYPLYLCFLTENDISNCSLPSSFYLTSWFSIFCSGTIVKTIFFCDFHFQLHVAISIIPLYWMQIFVRFECFNVFFFHRRDFKVLPYCQFYLFEWVRNIAMLKNTRSVADPGFPWGGGTNPPGGEHTILLNFPKNCMKSKEFGPGGDVQNFIM